VTLPPLLAIATIESIKESGPHAHPERSESFAHEAILAPILISTPTMMNGV
jgi:hypothetical protein